MVGNSELLEARYFRRSKTKKIAFFVKISGFQGLF